MAASFVEIHGCVATAIAYPYYFNCIQFQSAAELQEYTDTKLAEQEPVDLEVPDEGEVPAAPAAPARTTPRNRA